MPENINATQWWQRIAAAFIFFTRLPFWRIYQPPKACYATVVEHWPLTGWLTGGIMALVLYFGSMVFPWEVTVALAIATRILTTGALHEDGLADFMDGFGGGNTREKTLAIMKDSRIGTYGVLGLLLYFATLYACIYSFTPTNAAFIVFAGDAYSKLLAAQIVMYLPYARTAEQSKAHTVYRKFSLSAGISLLLQGVLPLALLFFATPVIASHLDLIIFIPALVMYFLYRFINNKIQGYTGDCCGALALLTELSFYLVVTTQTY